MKSERIDYLYDNKKVYSWDESLDTVYCYIPLPPTPPNIKPAKLFDIKITSVALTVGFKGNPPYLNHHFQGIVDSE